MSCAPPVAEGQTLDIGNLVLGTVQLGMAYGIANQAGQPDEAAAGAIVEKAWGSGIRFFDTAQAYGESEAVLGRALARIGASSGARVISKMKVPLGSQGTGPLLSGIDGSLARIGVPSLWGMMLHDEDDLLRGEGIEHFARAGKDSGKFVRAGVSVYSPEIAEKAIASPAMDLVQVPANPFDRRMQRAGIFARAAAAGKQVFIRSIYLQGLLLLPLEAVRARMPFAAEGCAKLLELCDRHAVTARQFAIDHARRQMPGARVLFGAETADQVAQNCAGFSAPALPDRIHAEWEEIWPEDVPEILDPRRWSTAKRSP